MEQGNPYSPLKVFHHRYHLAMLGAGRHVTPVHVQIILTNRCNQGCLFCSYRQPGYSSNESFDTRDEIPSWKLAEIIEDCKSMGVKAIEVTGGGEPTCHPHFLDICRQITELGMDLGLVTNGSKWSAEHATVLARAKWVRFSLDAGSPETYATLRHSRPEVYGEVYIHIRELLSARKGTDPLVGIGFVVNADNWQEVVDATIAAKEVGVDNIRLSAVFQNDGASYFDGFGVEAAKLCREAEAMATPTFRVFNLFGDRVHDLVEGKPDYSFCGFHRLCTYIGADENVYRCCVVSYNAIGLIGSLKTRRFSELWDDPETKRNLAEFDAHRCPRCMFHGKNRTIAYALDKNPRHVNFL